MSAVVYICRVNGFARRQRGRANGAAAFAIVVSLGVGAIGCGSSHDSSAGEKTTSEATSTTEAGTVAEASKGAVADKGNTSRLHDSQQSKAASEDPEGSSRQAPQAGDPASGGPVLGGRQAIGRKAAKYCPSGLDPAQCGALVEGFIKTKGADSQPMNEPRDCLEVMSRADCEALLAAQKAAVERPDSSVSVDECRRHPTPRCEAVLGRMFEEQYAASQAGK